MLPTIHKMEATFDSYWNTSSFEVYEEASKDKLKEALRINTRTNLTEESQFLFDLQPYPYQQEILDRLEADREVRGYYRNLVVAATGARFISMTGRNALKNKDFGPVFSYEHWMPGAGKRGNAY